MLNVELAPETALTSRNSLLALSPDGTLVAFNTRGADGNVRLAVRQLDQNQVTQLSGTENARSGCFFSPDGQWIAFTDGTKLKKIRATGGAAVTLYDAPIYSGDWGDDGGIIGALGVGTGLSRIPAAGGAAVPLTELNREIGEWAHRWPQVLPGSQAVLFSAYHQTGHYDNADIDVVWVKTGKRKTIFHGGFFGRYLPSGHLIYVHQNTLFAAPLDLGELRVTGEPQPLVENISNGMDVGANFAFSQTGTFIYVGGPGQPQRSIFWLDSAGKLRPLRPDPGLYAHPRFSPDGKRLAFVTDDGQGYADIRVQDLERDMTTRLNVPPGLNGSPLWTPDGRNIIFVSANPAAPGIYSIRADGSGEASRMTDINSGGSQLAISPDGKWLALVRANPISGVNIFKAPIEGDPDRPRLGKAEPLVESKYITILPAFSPDGRWLAYSSAESGRAGLWVRPFPGPGSGWQIWSGAGGYPIWSRNGRELFFLADRQRVMVVDYTARGDAFLAGQPRLWSERRILNLGSPPVYTYDLSPDGKRFVVVLYPDGTAEEEPVTHVTFLLNFFDELRQRVLAAGK
jgi:serine/threonine-protein kinase